MKELSGDDLGVGDLGQRLRDEQWCEMRSRELRNASARMAERLGEEMASELRMAECWGEEERWPPWERMEKREPETREMEKDERAERRTRRMGEFDLGEQARRVRNVRGADRVDDEKDRRVGK